MFCGFFINTMFWYLNCSARTAEEGGWEWAGGWGAGEAGGRVSADDILKYFVYFSPETRL